MSLSFYCADIHSKTSREGFSQAYLAIKNEEIRISGLITCKLIFVYLRGFLSISLEFTVHETGKHIICINTFSEESDKAVFLNFLPQALVLWKTIFPMNRDGSGTFGMIKIHYIFCALYFY